MRMLINAIFEIFRIRTISEQWPMEEHQINWKVFPPNVLKSDCINIEWMHAAEYSNIVNI